MSASSTIPPDDPGRRGAGASRAIPPSLLVLARFDMKTAEVLAIQHASDPPRKGKLMPVRLTDSTARDYPPGTCELVVAFHGRSGRHLVSWGQSARPKAFVDICDVNHKGRITGGLVEPVRDIRLLHVPVPKDAAYLAFYRNEVRAPQSKRKSSRGGRPGRDGNVPMRGNRLEVRLLGLYGMDWLDPFTPPHGDLEIPWTEPDLETLRRLAAATRHFPERGWNHSISIDPGGRIRGYDLIHGNGQTASNFNVVILGDGFSEGNDQDKFADRCELIKEALRTTEPFSSFFDTTNIFVVLTVSNDSGITNCPEVGAGPRSTYYRVSGGFGGVGYPGYVGSNSEERIYTAAGHIAPIEQLDLLLMVVNCPLYGGSAFIHKKIVYATLCRFDSNGNPYPESVAKQKFQDVCLHEMAHEIGRVGEEYIPLYPVAYDPLDEFSNIVCRPSMHSAWWSQLAESNEFDQASGKFTVVRDCTEASCSHAHNCIRPGETIVDPGLGLFWGAQYNDENITLASFDESPCPARSTAAGKDFFRGMAACKMKAVDWDFCRVCKHVLANEIRAAIGP